MRLCLMLFLIFIARPCVGSGEAVAFEARSAGMAGVAAIERECLPQGAHGLLLRSSCCNLYGIDGLNAVELTAVKLWRRAAAGFSMRALDTPTPYNEIHFLGASSLAAAEGLTVDTSLGLRSLRDKSGTFDRTATASIGFVIGGPEGLRFGCIALTTLFAASDPASSARGEGLFRWGLGLPVGRCFSLFLEEDRREVLSTRKLGVELRLCDGVALRAGLTDAPSTVCLGMGFGAGRITLDLAIVQHEALGVTPYLTVSRSTIPRLGRRAEPSS